MNIRLASYSASKVLRHITVALFLLSLLLTGIVTTHETMPGWIVLMLGWMGPLEKNFAWYANLPFAYALLLSKKSTVGPRVVLFYGFLLALSAFRLKVIHYDAGGNDVIRLGTGYYLWLLSFVTLFASLQLKKSD